MLIQDIMQTKLVTATPEMPLVKVLRLLQGRGFRHVPVVKDDVLVGIISDRDVKQSMVSAATSAEGRERDQLLDRLTAGQIMARSVRTIGPSSRVDVLVRDEERGLGDVVRAVEDSGARISSVVTLGTVGGAREVVLRLATIDPGAAIKALTTAGFTVKDGGRQRPR